MRRAAAAAVTPCFRPEHYLPGMADVAMPRLSDSMEEGTILKWLKSDGDEVKRGEELVEIETDKANMTYEADQDGVLSIVASEGDTLPVGDKIAEIGEGSGDGGGDEESEPAAEEESAEPGAEEESAEPEAEEEEDDSDDSEPAAEEEEDDSEDSDDSEPAAEEEEKKEESAPAPAAEAEGEEESAPEPDASEDEGSNGRIKASPVARRMAREMGLELARLEGTGPGGRIVKADVEAAAGGGEQAEAEAEPEEAEAAAPESEPEAEPEKKKDVPAPVVAGDAQTGRGETSTHDLTRLQQTVARRMAESKATAPDFVLHVDVEMDEAVELRKQLKAAAGDQPAPSFNDFVVKASALALREFPRANGAYRDGKFELYSRVNVGVAVAAQDALIVPTVLDADSKSLGQIARESRQLAERVRAGAITPPELSSGTFTVSNLGMFGIDDFVAVINPPQAAILAVGAMKPTPVVRDGEVVVRTMMKLTLACDHRILYGADAAEFLARIRERLESPLALAL
jgi:pyruvate dehydrogenase E2 component (dihydrolipoamide acetyltransferase)